MNRALEIRHVIQDDGVYLRAVDVVMAVARCQNPDELEELLRNLVKMELL